MTPWCSVVLVLVTWVAHVSSKAVFAHFMVTNTAKYERVTWSRDITLAKAAHIDAFALNLQYGDSYNEASIADAFYMAEGIGGFQLFFSFDYAGGGPWPKEDVISLLTKYSSSSAYFHHQGQPFVSTFEGPGSAGDWAEIKSRTACYFVPDWSSLGAKDAAALAGGVADGLFSWAAWPWGNKDSNTYVDASYNQFLAGKPYMMAISPWFYTNLPGFNKNWLWRGDHLWFDRWQEAFFWQPEWIEIISWNDYGESHHIGPVLDFALDAFQIGNAPFNYVLDHDAWRDTLPFSIDLYKNNKAHVDTEVLVAWYRLNPKDACDSGGTTANTASQLQIEFPPSAVLEDSVIFSAVLASDATISVTIGGSPVTAKWTFKPEGGVGMYHGSAPFGGHTGDVQVEITRGGASIARVNGASITTACSNGLANYNAWVGSSSSSGGVSADTPSLSDQTCINGTGAGNFEGLCEFACAYGYCPKGACLCTRMGKQRTLPKGTGVKGYPIAGEDESYGGLCGFSCGYGFCPSNACGTVQVPLTVATVSPFLPPACTVGEGTGQFEGLCKFSCDHGYCPIAVCTCTSYGVLNLLNPTTTSYALAKEGDDHGLCPFTCSRGYCPDSCSDPYADDEPPWPDWLDPSMIENDDWITDDSGVFCNAASKPGSLDELLSALDPNMISPLCWNVFASDILQDMLDQALDDYQSVLDGYDSVFGYYVDWVKDSITPALRKYMDLDGGPGNAYFSCDWTWGTRSGSGACPPSEQFWKTTQEIQGWSVTYTLVDSNGFYDAISKDLGIDEKWVKFADDTDEYACADQGDTLVVHGGTSPPCRRVYHKYYSIPVQGDSVTVSNPKDMVQAAMPNITELQLTLLGTQMNLAFHSSLADSGDVVTAAAMPILMLQGAVSSMASIKDIGEKAADAKKKELILGILSAVLLVIPFAGEALGALGITATTISRVALLISELGNAAISIVDIVNDPLAAPLAILGTLVGAGGFSGGERAAYKKAADARRSLSSTDLLKFSDDFRAKDETVQKIVEACIRY